MVRHLLTNQFCCREGDVVVYQDQKSVDLDFWKRWSEISKPTIQKNEFEFLTKSESNLQLRSVLCLRRPRGKPPWNPSPSHRNYGLVPIGAIGPGASRVTEDRSPLVPGCTIPIEALMAINRYCSPIGTPIGTPETSSYRGLLSQLLAKVIEAIASL